MIHVIHALCAQLNYVGLLSQQPGPVEGRVGLFLKATVESPENDLYSRAFTVLQMS